MSEQELLRQVERILVGADYAPYKRGVLGLGERTGFTVSPAFNGPRAPEAAVIISLTMSRRDLDAPPVAALALMTRLVFGYAEALQAAGLRALVDSGMVIVKP